MEEPQGAHGVYNDTDLGNYTISRLYMAQPVRNYYMQNAGASGNRKKKKT
jgi:hypothetical protein